MQRMSLSEQSLAELIVTCFPIGLHNNKHLFPDGPASCLQVRLVYPREGLTGH